MTYMHKDRPEPFVCVVCEREVDTRWWIASDKRRAMPPICSYCEEVYSERVRPPTKGAFRDRRNAIRITALAEALRSQAASIEWSRKYGRA